MSASASSRAATAKAIRDGRARTARILRELDRKRERTPPPALPRPTWRAEVEARMRWFGEVP